MHWWSKIIGRKFSMVYRKKPEHNPNNYLKVILESLDHYNSVERLDIANLLFAGYKSIKNNPKRTANQKALILEILSKWIQVLEDLAVVCLMFVGKIVNDNRSPFEIYSFIKNQKILEFYSKVKRGLPKKIVAKIYAIKLPSQLLKENLINKKEYPYFKQQIDETIVTASGNLSKLGELYSARREQGRLNYGYLVQVYFKTKHSFKVIQPTKTAKILWQLKDNEAALLEDVIEKRSGRKEMRARRFEEWSEADVVKLIDLVKRWTDVVKEIVGAQLRYLENPNFIVPMIRKLKTNELIKSGVTIPGRNDLCLCGSGIKYKKCCL